MLCVVCCVVVCVRVWFCVLVCVLCVLCVLCLLCVVVCSCVGVYVCTACDQTCGLCDDVLTTCSQRTIKSDDTSLSSHQEC